MKDAFVKIDGINFNQTWAATKTEKEFVDEYSNMDTHYPGLDKKAKTDALKAAYKQLTKAEAEPVK